MYADRQRRKVMERDAQLRMLQGDKLARRGLWAEAVAAYTESIDLVSTNPIAFFNRAKCYFEMHDYYRYVFDVSLAIHIEPTNYVLYVARSHGFYMLRKIQEALKDLDYALTQSTSSADLYFRRGVCYYDLRRWNDAISDFTRCLEINPSHPSAYSRRGAAYLKLKNGTLAVEDLKRSVNVNNRAIQHKNYFKYALANLIIGNAQASVDAFSSALELAQNYRSELVSKQRAKSSKIVYGISGAMKEEEEQKVDIRRVTYVYRDTKYQLIPFSDDEQFNIFDDMPPEAPRYVPSVYTAESSRIEKLNAEKAELEATERCFPEYLASRGKAKALLGRHSEALQDFSESITQSPENPQTYYERSSAFRIMGFYENALRDIEFCAHRKLNSDVAYSKAIVCENIGRMNDALTIYEAILAGVFAKPFTLDYLQAFGSKNMSSIDAVVELSFRSADESMAAAEKYIQEDRTVRMLDMDTYIDDLTEHSKRRARESSKAQCDASQDSTTAVDPALLLDTSERAQNRFFGSNSPTTKPTLGKDGIEQIYPKPRFFHLQSLYHAALLYRQKLNFKRAIELVKYALSLDPLDDKIYELLAMLHYDTLDYRNGIECIDKAIELQQKSVMGASWECYYLKAMCYMNVQEYSHALETLIIAQGLPAGGLKEVSMKQAEIERVCGILASLPPGSSISIGYLINQGVSAIPKDPLSPTSAARGYQATKDKDGGKGANKWLGTTASPSSVVFPILDQAGALPGRNNLHILLRKAECLFYLSDYIGCVRSCSLALREFDFSRFTHRGVRQLMNIANLIREHRPLRSFDLDQITKASGNEISPEEVAFLTAEIEVPLNSADKEYIFNTFFLRARALFILNRLERSVKDAFRARFVYTGLGTISTTGVGALLYFMSKLYAFLRLYTKSYHCARDAIKTGIPYYAVSRAHYMQGVALMYTGRRRLAAKCFSLALKCSFAARFAAPIFEHIKGEGIMVLPTLDEIARFVDLYSQYDPADHKHFPRTRPSTAKSILTTTAALKGTSGLLSATTADPSGLEIYDKRFPERSAVEAAIARPTTDQATRRPFISNRLVSMQSLPLTGTEADFSTKIAAHHAQRLNIVESQLKDSRLWTLAEELSTDSQNFDEFLILTNRLHQPENDHLLKGPLRFATTNSWVSPDNVFYLHERAKCLQELGLHELATDDFTTVIRFQPRNDRAYFRRGFSLRAVGLFDEAALDFEKARELRPDFETYQLDYERISKIGYLEVVPYGNEEFYDGTQLDAVSERRIAAQGLRDVYYGPTFPPIPNGPTLEQNVREKRYYYMNYQDVFEMVSTVTDTVRLARNVEHMVPATDEDLGMEADADVGADGETEGEAGEVESEGALRNPNGIPISVPKIIPTVVTGSLPDLPPEVVLGTPAEP
ncbi:Tetratricopeptide repeat protein [Giardia muris]|uniref:Tetratricopeptide repeat protein n=1 Tax=Giardia muris TaxID=5742 RepID=A0A4Z1STV6_GIAMU|nr:Tetratricopeptide repeat protein [Giardia muris]|eukprot:TNJ28415.1 Tetratricopeptide repeat protein [Giardia muris]